ncbi:hypothetical protein BDZ89DRAFT_1121327 [Hymenopellis radicata]|nr:hypothetical protein BDZ89DRAFT_1121327 [Hymenopellis radicata]
MATLSLHERLSAIKEPQFSATHMIKDLIECLSVTLTSSSLRRNTHTLCTAISRSRDLCDNINSLISASFNEDGWASFDAYTAMIDPLEKFLLELTELSENSCISSLSGELSILEWIEAGTLWAKNRNTTTATLTSLFEAAHFKSTAAEIDRKDLPLFRQHDDNAFLDELAQESSIRCNFQKSKFLSESWAYLEATLLKLKAIQSKLRLGDKNDMTEHSVKFMLVFIGVVEVTAKTSDKEARQHLASREVLSKVYEFSTLLETHSNNRTEDAKTLKTQREAQWNALIDALQKASGIGRVASPSFHELKKLPAKIRSPYYLQCLVLVQYCRFLFNERNKTPPPAIEPLERAMKAVTAALQAAANLSEAAAGNKRNVDALKTAEVDNAFTSAVKVTSDSFKEYRINGNSPAPTIEVVVKVSGKASTALQKDETYKVSRTSSLSMILWHACQRSPSSSRERVLQARFERPDQPGKALSLSDPISDVLGVTATTTKARVVLVVD